MALRALESINPSRKIGDVLIELGFIGPNDLQEALKKVKSDGPRLGTLLVSSGAITEEQLATALGVQFKLEVVDLTHFTPIPEALLCVTAKTAREKTILPLSLANDVLTIAVFDPLSIVALRTFAWKKKYELNFKISARGALEKAIDVSYKKEDRLQEIVKDIMTKDEPWAKSSSAHSSTKANVITHDEREASKDLGSIEALVDKIIENAIINGASDIHIEPDEEVVRVRERVDGILQEVSALPLGLGPALVSRIKILGNLDFAEKRNTQDGRIRVSISGRTIDLRIATLPTVRGEKIVLRILDKQTFNVELSEIGFSKSELATVQRVLESPFGIIFVTGPTGSGKSTTVYSMLAELNSLEKNIITIEDPVEYQFNVINQVQVQPKIGFTFANILRGVLRQDPDIIMVGEIRDKETADIAVRAALTGHLVITTLHTNNSISTITRLIDMGIEPSLISGSLLGVISQRLVRTLCVDCRKPSKIAELDLIRLSSARLNSESMVYYPVGCKKCRNTGFKGRTPIFELLIPDAAIRKTIVSKQSEDVIAKQLKTNGVFRSMREDGIDKVLNGLTTPTEILKATMTDD